MFFLLLLLQCCLLLRGPEQTLPSVLRFSHWFNRTILPDIVKIKVLQILSPEPYNLLRALNLEVLPHLWDSDWL